MADEEVERLAKELQSREETSTLTWEELSETRHEQYRAKARKMLAES